MVQTKCSKNLTSHIRVLKEEYNTLLSLYLNKQKVDKVQVENYLKHKQYVVDLYKRERYAISYNTIKEGICHLQ